LFPDLHNVALFPEGNIEVKITKTISVVFNSIFNNISVISWRSVLLVEETGVPGENH
jgi:hypothetical protein